MDENYNLIDGIDALKEGHKTEARKFLAAAIKENPNDEDAWLAMAYAVEDEAQYIECMQRVLAINPENRQAKKALGKVEAAEKASVAGAKFGRYGFLVIFVILALCIPAALFQDAILDLFSPSPPTPTRIQFEFTLTPSLTPSETPAPPPATETPVPLTSTATLLPSPTVEKHGAALFPCVPENPPLAAQVNRVVDGETIEVLIDEVAFLVGYIGVDAPGQEDDYGDDAAAANAVLVAGQEVWLYPDVTEWDENGRLLRYVFMGDSFVNYEMVRLGYAAAVGIPPDTACHVLFQETMAGAERECHGLVGVHHFGCSDCGTWGGNRDPV